LLIQLGNLGYDNVGCSVVAADAAAMSVGVIFGLGVLVGVSEKVGVDCPEILTHETNRAAISPRIVYFISARRESIDSRATTQRLALPASGRDEIKHFNGTNFKPRKMLENAQNPTCRVHALLACLYERGTC